MRRLKSEADPALQDQESVIQAIAAIGQHQRERTRIEADMNDQLAAIRQRFEAEAAPHLAAIQALQRPIQIWCEANRDALTDGGRIKTARLASGEVGWRMTPPRVTVRDLANVLSDLRRAGLNHMVRVKEEVNKEAILLEPEAVAGIKGLSISQREEFIVRPFETELEEVST
ncbi:MAG: host-nuclease inhibitor Gam family protein [Candidatus Contendobacter sp.]|nr:host-nuclease inhibitor Gam family protein [Candidatus Contendobacter sp.]